MAKRKKSVFLHNTVIGGKPILSSVAPLIKLPGKKDLFLGGLSANTSVKETKVLPVVENGHIRQLKNYIQRGVYPQVILVYINRLINLVS